MSIAKLRPLLGEVHHIGYIVSDLRSAVLEFSAATGAGPFFVTEHVELEQTLTGSGEPAAYEHSGAIGQLGDVTVEFMEVHDASPETVSRPLMSLTQPALHHIAWVVDDWDDVVTELDRAGAPSYMEARFGKMHTSYHDASSMLGHHIEIHQRNEDLTAFFGMIREASIGWDGTDPYRVQ